MSRFHYVISCGMIWIVSCGGARVCSGETDSSSTLSLQPRKVFKLPAPEPAVPSTDEHPLMPALRMAVDGYKNIRHNVLDYSCLFIRRERVKGRLGDHQYIYAKVRHRQTRKGKIVVPFSVYLKFLKPSNVKGREVLFVEGRNNGEMFARRGGNRFSFVTTRVNPTSDLAMNGNRYPITEFGMENLVRQLIKECKADLKTKDCQVNYISGAKINGRVATGIIVNHSEPSSRATFHEARVFIDDELNVPIHYEAYDWPREDGMPRLLEKYTYTKLKLNNGFTDADFDENNPNYNVK